MFCSLCRPSGANRVVGFKATACAVGYGYFARLRGLVAEFLPMMFFMQRARPVLLISLFAELFARSLLDDSFPISYLHRK